jgi:hypothetical protein
MRLPRLFGFIIVGSALREYSHCGTAPKEDLWSRVVLRSPVDSHMSIQRSTLDKLGCQVPKRVQVHRGSAVTNVFNRAGCQSPWNWSCPVLVSVSL